ncbi:MAG: DUF3616 domain-containing protein [Verrucomicrobia bacterium]|nr:DUF3616 domain-containing protein [Verrucomicrobiota bacterium]
MTGRNLSSWLATVLALWPTGSLVANPAMTFQGMANASAAVRVGSDRVLVGSDENNVLQLYSVTGGPPLAGFETSQWLGLQTRNREVDFEGAARLGDITFWLGSHGRNNSGEARPDRQRLLALRVEAEDSRLILKPLGPALTTLLDQLIASPKYARFQLAEAAQRAPEAPGGLNFEGLAAGPRNSLLLGLRNPVPEGKALVIPLLNPFEAIVGKPAEFGDPVQLDLGGKGIRDLAWTGRDYFIAAGSAEGGGKTTIYRWAGVSEPPVLIDTPKFKSLNPEAIVYFESPAPGRCLLLSDDGGRSSNETRNFSQRTFRGLWITP